MRRARSARPAFTTPGWNTNQQCWSSNCQRQVEYKAEILNAGQQAFVDGSHLGFAVGVAGALLAIAITWFFCPRQAAELATYAKVAGDEAPGQ
ncbi:hypothetical protein [Mycolicibacterium sp.]|uniref:hypothetical protein n=1 Tax=Mycolicibacterium sp. TaxID=2320850 RepID=UPI0028A6FD58|nr:hypothetical protein [Mycolicibacterium sp.]